MRTPAAETLRGVVYPESDGKPMGETDTHRNEMARYVIDVLEDHFAARRDVYVSGNNFIYWVEGKRKKRVSPDGYVVFGVAHGERRIFKVWEEGNRTPAFVIEVTSRKTRRKDLGSKMSIYRDDLRVPDYFVFDPLGEWAPAQLQGFALRKGVYQPLQPLPGSERLPCAVLGLELGAVDGHVRFFEPGSSEPLPTRAERARTAERVRAVEEARAREAEAEVERLRAEIAHLRARGRDRKK